MTDIRDSLGEGKSWEFNVATDKAEVPVDLAFSGLGQLPYGLQVWVVDRARRAAFPLAGDSTLSYFQGTGGPRPFELLVGTEAYIRDMTRYLRGIPQFFSLGQNFPNPFFSWTTIQYNVPVINGGKDRWIKVHLVVYDMQGRVVAKLANRKAEPGYYTVRWDGRTDEGAKLASGSYIVSFTAGDKFKQMRRMIKLR
jgi:hypothetical protein